MNRLMALCIVVVAIWAAVEIFTKGLDGAFGGLLTSSEEVQHAETVSRRAAGAFQRAYDKSEGRVDNILDRQPEQPRTN